MIKRTREKSPPLSRFLYQKQSLGAALRHARKRQRQTQADIACRINVSIPTIRALENDAGQLATYRRALHCLGLSLSGWWHTGEHAHIGTSVAALRQQRGLSQRALARAIAVSHPTIHKLEHSGDCRLDILQAVFRQLNYSLWIDSAPQPVAMRAADASTMTYLSLFSGIGGFDLALQRSEKKTSIRVVLALPKSIVPPSASINATSRTKISAMRRHFNRKICRTLNSWSPVFLARHFPSLANGAASTTRAARSFLRLRGLLGHDSHGFYCLRTSRGFSLMRTAPPSTPSSPCWMSWGTTVNGRCLTARISASPRTGIGCSLSDILEAHPDPRYFLSEKMTTRILGWSNRKLELLEH